MVPFAPTANALSGLPKLTSCKFSVVTEIFDRDVQVSPLSEEVKMTPPVSGMM